MPFILARTAPFGVGGVVVAAYVAHLVLRRLRVSPLGNRRSPCRANERESEREGLDGSAARKPCGAGLQIGVLSNPYRITCEACGQVQPRPEFKQSVP